MVACGIWDAEAQFESDIFYFAQFSNSGFNSRVRYYGADNSIGRVTDCGSGCCEFKPHSVPFK